MATVPTCPDCGMRGYLVVDGNEMTEAQLLHLPSAPKTIEAAPCRTCCGARTRTIGCAC